MAHRYQQTFVCMKCDGYFERSYEVGSNIPIFVKCDLCGVGEHAYTTSYKPKKPEAVLSPIQKEAEKVA